VGGEVVVEAEGYVRTVNDVGLSSSNIELTYDGDDYVIQWANNLSEYSPTGALLATAPLTGQSFSIAGLNGPESGQFVLLTGGSELGAETLDNVSELNSGNPASFNTPSSVAASNAIGLSDGGYAEAWFNDDYALSLSTDNYTVTLGTGLSGGSGGASYPALAQLSDGGIVVGWTNDSEDSSAANNISLAIVSPSGIITDTQTSGATDYAVEPAVAALNNGDFAEYWIATSNAVPSAVEEQLFTPTGAEAGSPSTVSTLSNLREFGSPSATTLSNGDVVLVYLQGGPQVVAGDGEILNENIIQGQVFSPDGAPIAGDTFSINTDATDANSAVPNSAFKVSVTSLADGDFAVGWINEAGDVKTQIFTLGSATIAQSEPSGDFSGDGYSSILWQNASGQAAIWELLQSYDGTILVSGDSAAVSPNPGPGWTAVATGDFNNDGHADILWQNADGQAAIWEMDGTVPIPGGSQLVGADPGPSWKVVGTGDFNGDGYSDILWQNTDGQAAIWEMDGTNQIAGGSQLVGSNPGPSWQAVGTGDFNGDGHSDILWQNTDGQVAIWEMNGTNQIAGGSQVLSSDPGPSWKVVGTGDFNGDGYSDILFQNTSSGQVAIWEMDGTNVIGGGVLSADPGPGWKAVGTGDFNGDGYSDILFQNTNGQAAIWEMNGTNVISGGSQLVGASPGSSWRVVGA
jgi:hypothetical protein